MDQGVPAQSEVPADATPADAEPADATPLMLGEEVPSATDPSATNTEVELAPTPPLSKVVPPPLPPMPPPLPALAVAIPLSEEEQQAAEHQADTEGLEDLAAVAGPALWRTRDRRLAMRSQRLGAFVVDGLLSMLLLLFALILISALRGDPRILAQRNISMWAAVSFPLVGLVELIWATSPGKSMLSIALRRKDGSHSAVGPRALRWLLKFGVPSAALLLAFMVPAKSQSVPLTLILAVVLVTIYLLNAVPLLIGDNRRALHDLIAGTSVFTDTGEAVTSPTVTTQQVDSLSQVRAEVELPAGEAVADDGTPPVPTDELSAYAAANPFDPEAEAGLREIEPAVLTQRLASLGVELLVLAIVWLLSLPFIAIFLIEGLDQPTGTVGVGSAIVLFVLTCGEFVGSVGIGKSVAGLRIASADDQSEPTPARRIIRYAIKYLPILLVGGFGAAAAVHAYLYGPLTGRSPPFRLTPTGELLIAIAAGAYFVAWSVVAGPRGQSFYDVIAKTTVYDATELTRLRLHRQPTLFAFEVKSVRKVLRNEPSADT